MDNATLAVLLTFGGTIVTAISGVVIAVVVNNRERAGTAEATADKLEEKWRAFKDEQIQDLRNKVADLTLKLVDMEAAKNREQDRADHLQMVIEEQRAEEQERLHER
jgi:hypothetical protein